MRLSPEKKQILNDIRPYLYTILATYVLILAVVAFSAWLKLSDFKEYQAVIAQSTAKGAATEISRYISDLEHRLSNFTRHYNYQLDVLSETPNDDLTRQELETYLSREVPEAFTFTIAKGDGSPIMDRFENPVARACKADISRFARSHKNHIEFHDKPVANHFDVMEAYTDSEGRERIFFASFKIDVLSHLLSNHRLPGYDMFVTSKSTPNTIDFDPGGSRNALDRETVLTAEELNRTNARVDVDKTGWQIVKIPSWSLYTSRLYSVLWPVLLAFIVTTLFALVMLYLVIRHEKTRNHSERRYKQLFDAERALVESEVRFRTLTNLSPVGTFFTDAAGICNYVNQAWANITGIEEAHWKGKTWTDVIHVDDREKIISDWATSVLKHSNYQVECRVQRPDGDTCWILCRASSVQTRSNDSTMYIGTAVDITERKKQEHELKLLAISFEAYEPIIITDGQGQILRVNDAFVNASGYSEEEILGKNPRMFSSGQMDDEFYENMWSHLTTHGNWTGEFLNRSKSGDLHQDWVTITALKDSKGKISNYIGHYQDITERKKAEEQIRKLAFYDPLTNLPNRRLFLERLDQELHIARNEGKFSALLFLDLDHFKNLNDSLGHPVGDALLVEVSKRLQRTSSEGETIARIGGDEFVILLPDLASSMEHLSNVAAHRAEQASIIITEPYYILGHEYHITVSIGIDLFPEEDQDSTDILKRADTAMYRAKQAGRNTICFFEPEMQVSADRRLTLEKDLRHAITQDELYLVYQPMIDWQGSVIGAEVLLRWQHSKLGSIAPVDFIPIAEDTGMIFDISEWTMNQVCAQMREWKDAGLTDHIKSIALNVSPKQFNQSGFENSVLSIVKKHGVDPACIEFEITEGLIISHLENSVIKMESMKKHGFHFSVDDFGTGYSSLAYLRQLPINRLKIDQSFVRNIKEGSNDATIVETIISMAHHLGLVVVAEGVENRMQHYFLMQHSCDIYQGDYFSKPVRADEFIKIDIQQDAQPGSL